MSVRETVPRKINEKTVSLNFSCLVINFFVFKKNNASKREKNNQIQLCNDESDRDSREEPTKEKKSN